MMKKILQGIRSWIAWELTYLKSHKHIAIIIVLANVSAIFLGLYINSDPTSDNQTQPSTESSLWPIIEQTRQQYSDLWAEHIKLQAEYVSLQFTYETAKQDANNINALLQNLSTDSKQVSDLQAQLTQLRGELPNLRVALQVATDERRAFEQRFLNSQYEKTLLLDRIEEQRLIHQDLLDRIAKVTDRTDNTTTSNLTAEKRANFYEMWGLWVETLSENK